MTNRDSYRQALNDARLDLAHAEDKYVVLGSEIQRLRNLVTALEDLAREYDPSHARRISPLPGLVPPEDVPEPRTSTERVVAIVNASARPMTFSDIITSFGKHDWIDDSWENPNAAISQAARRAADQGFIVRRDDGSFISNQLARALASAAERNRAVHYDPGTTTHERR